MGRGLDRLARSLRRPRDPDPFEVLALQLRLSRLAAELDALLGDDARFARGFHLTAVQMAYDRTLLESCRLVGIDDVGADGAVGRLLAESALRGRGWTW